MGHPINLSDAMDAEMNGKENLCVHRVSAVKSGFRIYQAPYAHPFDTAAAPCL